VRDALAHAQSLWALGNQTGAVELLRDVLQSAEKSAQQPGMDSTLIAVVRELARMQLAMGRVAEAHDVLVHFESRLKAIPEIWAMRANAAQRLGQHQDSVLSYMQALQARPNEQRWLLGLAVSLAAMGQTASASEVVERALQQGPINRDIAAYLRQMGVNIK
jgi:Flp pilus assembly protein TadD